MEEAEVEAEEGCLEESSVCPGAAGPGPPSAGLAEEPEAEGTLDQPPLQSEAMRTLMNSAAVRKAVQMKASATDNDTAYQVDKVQFDILGSNEISQLSQLEVVNRELYVHMTNTPHPFGVLDLRLGQFFLLSSCTESMIGRFD